MPGRPEQAVHRAVRPGRRARDAVVVVTGASSGIGRATAVAFARRGARPVLAARREEALWETARECAGRRGARDGGRILVLPTDVTDPGAVRDLVRRTVAHFGRIDVWVNCAAVVAFGRLDDVPAADDRRVLEVNVLGTVHAARAVLPVLRAQGHGTLINVSSVVAVAGQPFAHSYAMSKAAVRTLGAGLRQELWLAGEHGISVCTVLPSSIDTPIFTQGANYTGHRIRPVPPVYPPERVARAVVELARSPRPEIVVGGAGRGLAMAARLWAGAAEKTMAHRSGHRMLGPAPDGAVPDSAGNLYEPTPGAGSAHGGWGGGRAARRLAAAAAVTGVALGLGRILRHHR
ncbi:SDR family NAD(P)-dependent oxidoreductase [Streptomyces aidingensis]|uniref:Short-chain dehydrogenase n=1 Tax=Streptomyces aidingensis TaxID=910347 RepID=A0A1I1ETP6_9ACTN|nr:SDR family NAD(P)-dependent oxidoreductase [Streptomyces aidingensis]SFB88263.1 Short-chain dehydrogenase [Streptomyces aidingensis]